jgi:hypothetical protein
MSLAKLRVLAAMQQLPLRANHSMVIGERLTLPNRCSSGGHHQVPNVSAGDAARGGEEARGFSITGVPPRKQPAPSRRCRSRSRGRQSTSADSGATNRRHVNTGSQPRRAGDHRHLLLDGLLHHPNLL